MLYRTGWPKTRSCLPSAEIPGIQHHTQQYNLELKPDSGTSPRLCSSDLDPPWVCVLTCKARAASESWWSDGIQEFQTLTMCNFSKGPRTFKTRKKILADHHISWSYLRSHWIPSTFLKWRHGSRLQPQPFGETHIWRTMLRIPENEHISEHCVIKGKIKNHVKKAPILSPLPHLISAPKADIGGLDHK